jgi:hypothetical protein
VAELRVAIGGDLAGQDDHSEPMMLDRALVQLAERCGRTVRTDTRRVDATAWITETTRHIQGGKSEGIVTAAVAGEMVQKTMTRSTPDSALAERGVPIEGLPGRCWMAALFGDGTWSLTWNSPSSPDAAPSIADGLDRKDAFRVFEDLLKELQGGGPPAMTLQLRVAQLTDSLGAALAHTEVLETLLEAATGDLEEARQRIRLLESAHEALHSAQGEKRPWYQHRLIWASTLSISGVLGNATDAVWEALPIGPERSAIEHVVNDNDIVIDLCQQNPDPTGPVSPSSP